MNKKNYELLQLTTDTMSNMLNKLYKEKIIDKKTYLTMLRNGINQLYTTIIVQQNEKMTYLVNTELKTIKKDIKTPYNVLFNETNVFNSQKEYNHIIKRESKRIIVPFYEKQLNIKNLVGDRIENIENNYSIIDKNSNYFIICMEKEIEKDSIIFFTIDFYLYCGDDELIKNKNQLYEVINLDNQENTFITIEENNLGEKRKNSVGYNQNVCSNTILDQIANRIMIINDYNKLKEELSYISQENNIQILKYKYETKEEECLYNTYKNK